MIRHQDDDFVHPEDTLMRMHYSWKRISEIFGPFAVSFLKVIRRYESESVNFVKSVS
jgi:hypothetical protein